MMKLALVLLLTMAVLASIQATPAAEQALQEAEVGIAADELAMVMAEEENPDQNSQAGGKGGKGKGGGGGKGKAGGKGKSGANKGKGKELGREKSGGKGKPKDDKKGGE